MTLMNLELQILTVLRNAGERLVLQSTLVANLRLLDRKETLAEINTALASMEEADEVIGLTNRDTGTKWQISDAGRARLITANL